MTIASLSQFSAQLRRLPRVVAQAVTTKAAPAITEVARRTFNASADAYGIPWVPGSEGQRVTLMKSGALARRIQYVGLGTKLRVALGVPYAKYQIGKRPVFPSQGQPLPEDYVRALQRASADVVRASLRGEL